jgi:hypothetical protein
MTDARSIETGGLQLHCPATSFVQANMAAHHCMNMYARVSRTQRYCPTTLEDVLGEPLARRTACLPWGVDSDHPFRDDILTSWSSSFLSRARRANPVPCRRCALFGHGTRGLEGLAKLLGLKLSTLEPGGSEFARRAGEARACGPAGQG